MEHIEKGPDHRSEEQQALELMRAALQKLDQASAPGHIGAHLDLAIERLREYVEGSSDEQSTRIDRAAG